MSSPIAKTDKSRLDRALIATHRQLSHGHRIDVLAREFATRLAALAVEGRRLKVLDVGCGDMTLVDAIGALIGAVDFQCVDVHPLPVDLARDDARWARYRQFDGRSLPFDEQAFDVVMFSDVLHHVPPALRVDLLRSAGRTGRCVLVKDHFEYGWASRQTLRLMDFVGNFGYGVSVPERYFDAQSWAALCAQAGLERQRVEVGVRLYDHLPLARRLLSPRWHFFAHCRRVPG